MRHSKFFIAWYYTKTKNTPIVTVHRLIQKQFLYQTYDIKAIHTTFQFSNALYKYIYQISNKCISYTKFLRGEVGTKACGLDDVFLSDSLWFGSDAGRELCCM